MLKILSLAQDQVGGSPEKLQETAMWLLSQQRDDGSFHDPYPVMDRSMQVWGWETGPRTQDRKVFLTLPTPS